MIAAEEIRHMSDKTLKVQVLETGKVLDMPYRKAVGLLSRGTAVIATDPEPTAQDTAAPKGGKGTKKAAKDAKGDPSDAKSSTNLSTPAREGQEGASAENEPLKTE